MKTVLKLEITLLKTAMKLLLENLSNNFPGLKESTIGTFKKKVEKKLNNANREKRDVNKSILKYSNPTRRLLLFGELSNMVQVY